MNNRWGGERISIAQDTPTAIIQVHLSRYIWAMFHCTRKTVLDAGCGTGYGTWLLGSVAEEAAGLDRDEQAIAEARNDFNGIFLHMALEDAPKQTTQKYDVVVAFEMLEHLNDVDVGLGAIRSLMKDDGLAIISLPLHQPSEWHHFRDYGYDDWREILIRHFGIPPDGVYYQPMEETPYWDGNVHITRMSDDIPETGIIIFLCRKVQA